MDEIAIIRASKYSIRNRLQLENSEMSGCYHCLSIFQASEVVDWTDGNDTAMCPKCGIDSVLGDNSPYEIAKENLMELKSYWFNG